MSIDSTTLAAPTQMGNQSAQATLSTKPRQRTLKATAEVAGMGMVTGADVHVRMCPAPANSGISFTRVDLPDKPTIPVSLDHLIKRRRRTAIGRGDVVIEMTEHILSALMGLEIDNAHIEIDAGELPGGDGSALCFVEAIDRVGTVTQDASAHVLTISQSISVQENNALVTAMPGENPPQLQVGYTLDYPQRGLCQSADLLLTPDAYRREIAPARTFVFDDEVEQLKAQGLGSKMSFADLLVLDQKHQPISNSLRYPNELARHKLLDVLGDLAFVGKRIAGRVFAHRSGHWLNGDLANALIAMQRQLKRQELMSRPPLLEVQSIERILPHRYPFLLIDRVLELAPNESATGIKNVTCNEPFFQGHWPGKMVMPGVLILEGLAQLAGIMLTQWHEKGVKYAVLAAMNQVKLRRAVVPGDQLWLYAETRRARERLATVYVEALVGDELAAQAEISFVVTDKI